ncbi:uncharacterized protein METZ01_LOCUS190358, partial [marine metagenome]
VWGQRSDQDLTQGTMAQVTSLLQLNTWESHWSGTLPNRI